ncbi:ABC transporter substrate-binding protein [Psychrobacter sp. NPDC078370]|jgi:putative ABC transport system substrate-binding protein|uniref:ABC transporter, substrate-binding protein n=2 Tax=Psychrobacter TaxID=497 RepID=A0A6N7C1I1_9GAMM|nr:MULTISPECIES: ABC transporter substrate-binding protein [Psychrobacter]KAF0569999.1 ABC transporter, substrate-binding protein [Psychrobacter nivimaris]MCG3842412.1 ABC transporter substrate-binding protein [Psychrobacter sp. Ps1]NYR09529.1 ABC transporter substrate-binding protein [Psychrobacter sp. BI730]PKH68047.1 ABC transporter substrate-binding protein [Psychrobacter sp. 4Dc]PLT20670.1 ABC transporter substrate-binding protein [Psychrobacter sp. MES7-P7E]
MTIASTLRLSLYGVALSAISTLGLIGCSNSSTETAATAENSTATDKPAKSIAITQIVEHPSLDDMRRGIIDELADNGYVEGQNLTVNFQSAQGNTATAGQIAKQFAGDNPDAIVAISTPSAQSVVAATTTIPIIYTAVSDPLGAKLITADGKPFQSNLTGLSSQLPLEPQLDLLQQIKPDLKTIGYVYSPGEANSVSLRENLKQALPARGLSLLDIPANRPTDIGMATRSLQGRADIIYTSFDNNVASAFEAMTQAANELKLPIIASDEFSVKRGATAALGVNDYDFGRTTGKMVYRVLNGEAVNTIKPEVMNDLTLYVSPKHAKTQGVSLPAELLKNAINVDIDAETK